jgi:hypothetical protein
MTGTKMWHATRDKMKTVARYDTAKGLIKEALQIL